jgi:hypothetical protein
VGPDDLALDFDPLHTLGFLATDWIEALSRSLAASTRASR